MEYATIGEILATATKINATHVTLDLDAGHVKMPLHQALTGWEDLAPGMPYTVVAMHWDKPVLHFSGSDPTDDERTQLEQLHSKWCKAQYEQNNRTLRVAAVAYIEELMTYAGISEA